jgi:hypothetical protein
MKFASSIWVTSLFFFSCTHILQSSHQSNSTQIALSGTRREIFTANLISSPRSLPSDFLCFNVNSVRVQSWTDPKFTAAVHRLSPQSLRIPGGDESNYWDWKRGGLIQNLQGLPDGLPFFLRYGDRRYTGSKLIDFKAGLVATKTHPTIVLNMLSSTLPEQMQMLQQAKLLGIPVKQIELGNEFFFATQNYRSVFSTPEKYAQAALEWTKTIKSEFPDAQISVVAVSNDGPTLGPRYDNWNSLVLPSTLSMADAVSLHVYPGHGLSPEISETKEEYPYFTNNDVSTILNEPLNAWRKISNSKQFQVIPPNKKIWVTEYNLHEKIFENPQKIRPRVMGSWTHGLYALKLGLLFLEDTRVEKICNHMLIGNSLFSAIYLDENSFINPSGLTLKTQPFSFSGTGTTLQLLGAAIKGNRKAQSITFSNKFAISKKGRFADSMPYGWFFSSGSPGKSAIILNLSFSEKTVQLDNIFPNKIFFRQVAAPPRTLVSTPDAVKQVTGNVIGSVTLAPYSVTLVSDRTVEE